MKNGNSVNGVATDDLIDAMGDQHLGSIDKGTPMRDGAFDMSDDEKIMASISGGNASRQFHPYFKSQLDSWLNEEFVPWWLDRQKISENSKHELTLNPK